ncbi:topoisomerase DNA-binding C4 zinc finger domain-containing protein [Faecalibacterium sp. An192]|uniref:topoisomerase DNA-binding C4 zinc finger domain-containing protein n=1 Tax=Faecalibacterium sp. An192 TaxID=1965581 RepID=UPI000B3769ED|nr:topoisomerase DNA-binding C4 zinc finger domain-containing protein [Faecalibacterium sp. An192]OUP28231.1 hypothetical protein B5F27_07365 [Faecalibacterium sp. An192]
MLSTEYRFIRRMRFFLLRFPEFSEQHFDGVIPDVVVYSGEKYFFIEIFVTHPVDERKLSKLQNNNISTLEIDLSKFDRMIPLEELQEILLQSNKAKKWLYNAVATKWLSRFKKVADKKSIVEHSYALHVYDCPLKMRTWHRRTYANIIDDCFYCEYCISNTDGIILCSGRQRIAHIKDFNVSLETRLKSEARMKELHYCPLCGSLMMKRQEKYGSFWECSRYPQCKATISAEE